METKEIVPTDGRGRRRSPYLTEEEKANLKPLDTLDFQPAVMNTTKNGQRADAANSIEQLAEQTSCRGSTEEIVDELRHINQTLEVLLTQIGKLIPSDN